MTLLAIKFACVGVALFVIDVSSFSLLRHALEPLPARVVSLMLCLLLGWWLNGKFTFMTTHLTHALTAKWISFLRYVLGACVALMLNFLCFVFIHTHWTPVPQWEWLTLVPGIALGAVINFAVCKHWAFDIAQHPPSLDPDDP